jgi:hypothetical protein
MAQPAPGSAPLPAAAQPGIDAKDAWGHTALHRAARSGNVQELQQLLAQGANIEAQNNIQKTPLHEAAEWGHAECVRVLLEGGANPNIQDQYGHKPLHKAAEWGRTDCVRLLLERGIDPNIQSKYRETSLRMAATHNRTDIVQLLLTHILACGDADYLERLRPLVAQLVANPKDTAIAALVMELCFEAFAIGYNDNTPPVAEDDPRALAQRNADMVQAFRQHMETYVLEPLQADPAVQGPTNEAPHFATLAQSLRTFAEAHWQTDTQKQ